MHLGPGDIAGLGEIDNGRFVFIQADADDLEAGVVVRRIGGLQTRQLGKTGTRTRWPRNRAGRNCRDSQPVGRGFP